MKLSRTFLGALKGTNKKILYTHASSAKHNFSEHGRTLIEMLGALFVIALLSIGVIKTYHFSVNKVKMQATAKAIKTLALERQNAMIDASTGGRRRVEGPYGDLYIENATTGKLANYFWVDTTLNDKDFCEALKKSDMISAEIVEGTCPGKITFYFKKDIFGTTEGTYTDETGTHFCPEHVATCTDENTPITCDDGYLLFGKTCVSTTCTVDSDCTSVCASCDNGTCTNECEIPEPDEAQENNKKCGENDCVVYDEETQSCQYKCRRLEYLESTGKQYIDTDFIANQDTRITADFEYTKTPNNNGFVFGAGISAFDTAFEFYTWGTSWNSPYNNTNIAFSIGTSSVLGGKIHIDKNKNVIDITYPDGTSKGSSATYGMFTTTGTLYLFAINRGSTTYTSNCVKLYSLKIYDNGTLVRDFIPILAPDGKPCMFDKVSGKLFHNLGTEAFKTNLDD